MYANAAIGEVYDNLSEDIDCILEGNKLPMWTHGRPSYKRTALNLSLHDFMADACVNLVKIIDECGSDTLLQKREGLIKEGFNYSSIVETMWKRGDTFVAW